MDRFMVFIACFSTALTSLGSAITKAQPEYVPVYWWEAPWWLVLIAAPLWVWIGIEVLRKGVK